MTNAELLDQLQDLTHRLGIEIRSRSGEFTGGICRVQGQRIFFLNNSLSMEKRIEVLCRELSRLDLSGVFIIPALRIRLEQTESAEKSGPLETCSRYPDIST